MATHVYIDRIGDHVGQTVTLKGWLVNRRSSGKIHFLLVRDGTGFLQVVMGRRTWTRRPSPAPITSARRAPSIITGMVRADQRAKGGYELIATGMEVVAPAQDFPITPEGARRRLPDGPAAPVDSHRAPDRDPARASRGDRRHPRLLQRRGLHPGRHADLHAGGLRGHDHAVPGAVLRRHTPPTSRRAASSTTKPTRWRWARCTASGRRSAPRRARRAATSPSSGWWSRRWPTPTSTTSSAGRAAGVPRSSAACSIAGSGS